MVSHRPAFPLSSLLICAGLLSSSAYAADVLATNGFQSCLNNGTIKVQKMNVKFDHSTNRVNFDVAGTSEKEQNVTAHLEVFAYGHTVYTKDFDPCGNDPHVDQLCPVPKGQFGAEGAYSIPQEYASSIPDIAYNIPDLDGQGKLELKTKDPKTGKEQDVACIKSQVTNQKTTDVPGITWAAAAIAAAALLVSALSGLAALGASSSGTGVATSSPTFTEVVHWFQGIAMNGMISVQYPSVYRSFTQNFAFSTAIIPWNGMEMSIDSFRSSTGGDLTGDSVQDLKNSTIVYSQPDTSPNLSKRAVGEAIHSTLLYIRDGVQTNVNGTTNNAGGQPPANGSAPAPQNQKYVSGIEGYVAAVTVPKSNVFMTALLIFAIVLASITAGILLFKVILEAWALFGKFPKKLTSFRKNYWWLLAKTITNLILLLYGVWTLYCVYQLKEGDSWAAKLLAAVTLSIFTVLLAGFTWKIWSMAHKHKKAQGDASAILYEDKEIWRKYSIFYDSYKRSYWWLFVPSIVYMFAKGCVLAGADQHSLVQTGGLIIVDTIFLVLLLLLRPYNLKSGNWINITIQVVRVISVVCVLIFVEKLGFSQTTKTVTGVILIALQGALTGLLGILIAVNAIINCARMNPHRKARKDAEKQKDVDNLTPLDAHNSLLLYPMGTEKGKRSDDSLLGKSEMAGVPMPPSQQHARGRSQNGYDMLPLRDESNDRLASSAAPMGVGHYNEGSRSPSPIQDSHHHRRQPQLPDLEYKGVAI